MIKRIIFVFTLFIFVFSPALLGQSRSDIKDKKIKKVTVYKEEPQKWKGAQVESIVTYDTNGKIIEEIEYDDDGLLKFHLKYEYDENLNKIKETELDKNGKIIKVTEYKYEGEFRTERTVYDDKGKLKTRRTYKYETF